MIEVLPIHNFNFDACVIGDTMLAQAALVRACAAIQNKNSATYSIIRNAPETDSNLKILVQLLCSLGYIITQEADRIEVTGFSPPQNNITLNLQNAGFALRLLIGLAAGITTKQNIQITFETDFPLAKRNISRTLQPLNLLGFQLSYSERGTPPVKIFPSDIHHTTTQSLNIDLPIPNYLVKSAAVVSGACSFVEIKITEPYCSRNFVEKLFGCNTNDLLIDNYKVYQTCVEPKVLEGINYFLPSDFLLSDSLFTLALLRKNSELTIKNRSNLIGEMTFLSYLAAIGVKFDMQSNTEVQHNLELQNLELQKNNFDNNFIYSDILRVKSVENNFNTTKHKKVVLNSNDVSRLGASIPILAVVCAATGIELIVTGAIDMRQQTCDRISAIVNNFAAFGIETEEYDDGFRIKGTSGLQGNCELSCFEDLSISLAMILLCVISKSPSVLHDLSDDYRVKYFLKTITT